MPVPDERLPESWEAWLQNGQFPVVESSDSYGDSASVRDPGFNQQPPFVIAAAQPFDSTAPPAASSARPLGTRTLAPATLPPTDVKRFSESPDLIEIKRLPKVGESSQGPPSPSLLSPSPLNPSLLSPSLLSPSLSAPQNSLMKKTSLELGDDGLIEVQETPRGPSSDIEQLHPEALPSPAALRRDGQSKTVQSVSKAALLDRRRLIFMTALLLIASGSLLRRRRRALVRSTDHQDMLPKDHQQWTVEPDSISSTQARCEAGRGQVAPRRRARGACGSQAGWFVVLACCLLSGCSSLTNPVLNGIPVRKLPPELLSQPDRDHLQTVPLSLLRQKQPEDYILGAGDVLGVFIAGVFPPTTADQPLASPPVYFPSQIDPLGAGLPPSLGYPVTIRNDGTLSLPLVEPISLEGLTVEQANERVREAYATKGILQPGRESVMLTLMQPRQIRILVFRQEVGGFAAGGRGDISSNGVKRGTGHIINLRAYDNDVVNALANTGGLPGLDAYSGIYIFRGGQSNLELTQRLESSPPGADLSELSSLSVETDYIPTRWLPTEPMPFQAEDVILHEGDVVLLEARVEDLFYTGGLLPAAERVLPRDYDLDVVEAVLQASGTLVNGAFGGNNFNGLLIQKGIGNPNPSALTVVRRTPNGGQIPIFVDLNRALVDPRERILVQAGDVLILQETRQESMARYFNDIFNFNVFWQVFQRGDATGATAVTQLPRI